MTELSIVLAGAGGGAATLVLGLIAALSKPANERPTFSSWLFWVVHLAILPGIGAGLVWAYGASGVVLNPILAINIGASGPLILRGLAAGVTFEKRVD